MEKTITISNELNELLSLDCKTRKELIEETLTLSDEEFNKKFYSTYLPLIGEYARLHQDGKELDNTSALNIIAFNGFMERLHADYHNITNSVDNSQELDKIDNIKSMINQLKNLLKNL